MIRRRASGDRVVSMWHAIPMILAFPAGVAAQGYLYSPASAELHEGGTLDSTLFTSSRRYQQIHADTKGAVKVIAGLALRRDCSGLEIPGTFGPRTLDVELFMGDSNHATATTTFGANYATVPFQVFNRKNLVCPDHAVLPDFQPAPWDVVVPFDAPYVYVGVRDLAWEVLIHGATSLAAYSSDAYSPTMLTAGFAAAGTGCTTLNGVMKLRTIMHSLNATNNWTLAWSLAGGPSSSTTAIMVGVTNPNLAVPGLCAPGRLYTDNALFTVTTTTSAGGLITPSPFSTPLSFAFDPALVGLALTAQAAALDPLQPGLGVAASNGNRVIVPPLMPTAPPIGRLYANFLTATTGAWSPSAGLVTRFQ